MPALPLLLAAALLLCSGPLRACTKSLRWHEDPPFSQRAPNGEVVGLQIDLARAVLARMGCELRLLDMPFARALVELEGGRLDMLPGTFQRPERELYAHFSAPIVRSRNMLYVRRAELERVGGQSLRELVAGGFQLGAQIGVVYGPAYAELMADPSLSAKVQQAAQRRGLWQMLARKRIDGLIADEASAAHELRELGLSDAVSVSALVVSDQASGTAFSKRSVTPEFVARYDATVRAMQQDGSLAALLARYGLKP